jgi:hypothetical protein
MIFQAFKKDKPSLPSPDCSGNPFCEKGKKRSVETKRLQRKAGVAVD